MRQGIALVDFEVVRPQDLTPASIERWAALQSADIALDSPFLSPQWARAVERVQGEGARNVRVAILKEAGREVGFFPARVGSFTAMPVGAPMCDYQGLVAEPGLRVEAKDLIGALGVDRLDFTFMLEEQAVFAKHARGRDLSYVVDVAGGYEAYEAERRAAGTSVLKDGDKKRRKVEREVGPVEFLGSHVRTRLVHPAFADAPLTAQLSQNLARRVGLREGGRLAVSLPAERIRVFDAEATHG